MQPAQEPIPPHVFHVLLAIHQSPLHGYGIKKVVAEATDGAVDLDVGGLYRALARLEERGWIQVVDAPDSEADSRRKYYALTEVGQEALGHEAARLMELSRRPDVIDLAGGTAGP